MKKLNIAFLVLILFSIISCEVEESFTPNPQYTGTQKALKQNKGVMTAKVDGKDWIGVTIGASKMNGVLNVTGVAADGSTIVMTLIDKGEGDYNLKDATDGNAAYQVSQGSVGFGAADSGGTVNVTAINMANKTLSGTFSFTGFSFTDSAFKVITNGQFLDVPYATELASSGNGNTLSADIDGVTFTAFEVTAVQTPGFGFNIVGSDNMGAESIGFRVPDDIDVGTYDLDAFSDYTGQYNASINEFYQAKSGQLVISKHDKSAKIIEGTFNFKGETLLSPDSVNVTNGVFKAKY